MARVINITEKLTNDKPQLIIGEKTYEVNNSMESVLKFEELASNATLDNMVAAINLALGNEASDNIQVKKLSVSNFRVLAIAILAAMQDMSYEDAESRFQRQQD